MTGHDEVEELLGAYALDAVDPAEAEMVERHLAVCPRCRAELANHREVAGLLGYAGGPAPDRVWDLISRSLGEPPPALRLGRIPSGLGHDAAAEGVHEGFAVPGGPAVHGGPAVQEGAVAQEGLGGPEGLGGQEGPDGESGGSGPRSGSGTVPGSGDPTVVVPLRRRGSLAARVAGVVAVAAVAAVAVLGVQVSRLDNRTDHLRAMVVSSTPDSSTIVTALSTPGARQVDLSSSNGQSLRAVIAPNGSGYLFDSKLRPLPKDETYQLWGHEGGRLVSYGLLGSNPTIVPFRAGRGVGALAVTAEQAGGVVRSSHKPIVAGLVRTTT